MNSFKRLAKLLDQGTPIDKALQKVSELEVDNVKITDIPTTSTGLVSGQIWSNSGVLTIVS